MLRIYLSFVGLVLAGAIGLYWASYSYFKAQDLATATARLSLYQSTVEAELQRFRHLPFVLSVDTVVQQALKDRDTEVLNRRLASFAQRAGLDAIYVMDPTGLTIAASNAGTSSSFVGQNYSFRPYFQAAKEGRQGEFYGIGATTGIPGYFFAEAVQTPGVGLAGVVAIKINLSTLQTSWQEAGEGIILSNSDGVVLLASEPAWRYRTLGALTADQETRIAAARQFGTEPLTALDWAPNPSRRTATLSGEPFLYLSTSELPNGWSLHYFTLDDQAVTRAWLATGAGLLLGGILVIAFQVRRVQRIGLALRRSEDEEAQLRAANERLAVEIEERRNAERTLKKTQTELERAGRLAALGTLASSVTHELGQPIAAMRNHLVAAELQAGSTALTQKMQGLVARMEDITRQLKFFSRKGRDRFETIDLADAMQASLDLLEPHIDATQAQVRFDRPDHPVSLYANKLRMEQVMTNLIRNALDAVDGRVEQEVIVTMGRSGEGVWFEVADTGHGLGDLTLEDLREPFATTRESGQGMGLGLTISAGIVTDHQGVMTAQNRPGGGATFKVSFAGERAVA